MSVRKLNAMGWLCPRPTLEMTIIAQKMKKGDILEVVGDCPSFEYDIKSWCQRMNKILLWLKKENNGTYHVQVKL